MVTGRANGLGWERGWVRYVSRLALSLFAAWGGSCGPSVGNNDANDDETVASAATDVGTETASDSVSSTENGRGDATTTADPTDETSSTSPGTSDSGATAGTTGASCADHDVDRPLCRQPAGAFTEVDGTTPLGPFAGAFAWAGWGRGKCDHASVIVTSTIAALDDWVGCGAQYPPPAPSLNLFLLVGSEAACLASTEADITVRIDEMEALTVASVEITACASPSANDPEAPVVIEGTLTAHEDGWMLAGSFSAAHCESLDTSCP